MNGHTQKALGTMMVVIVLVACGPGGTTDSSTTTTAMATTTQVPSVTQPGGTGGIGGISQACIDTAQAFIGAMAGFSTVIAGMTPAQAEAYITQLGDTTDKIPAELKDDFEVISQSLGVFYEGIADMGMQAGVPMTPAQIAIYSELAEKLEEESFEEAMERLTDWFETNCSSS